MSEKIYTSIEKDAIRKRFLYIPKRFKPYLKNKEIFWIYEIINLENDKVYIGKTSDIKRRALNYVNDYLKGDISRPILRAFQEIGFEKFIIFPLEVTDNEESAQIKEKYYIDDRNSISEGYNVYNNSAPTYTKRKRPSVPQTLYSKMIKSKTMVGINTEEKKIVFSTGLKLFGDLIGRTKDEVKSAARRETRLNGYFIYYLNTNDFSTQLLDAKSKISRNKVYSDFKLQYYDFVKYSDYLKNLLKNNENPEKFEIFFITQSNDICGFKYENPEKFFEYYKTASSSII